MKEPLPCHGENTSSTVFHARHPGVAVPHKAGLQEDAQFPKVHGWGGAASTFLRVEPEVSPKEGSS